MEEREKIITFFRQVTTPSRSFGSVSASQAAMRPMAAASLWRSFLVSLSASLTSRCGHTHTLREYNSGS